jgi:excisionase family DNA binding protein
MKLVEAVKFVEVVEGTVMIERVATSAEVASALGLSASTVQLYARQGRIPFATTPGGHRRYSVSEVQLVLSPSPTGDTDDAVTMSLSPLPTGLSEGHPAPRSANAQLLRAQRVAVLESPSTDDAPKDQRPAWQPCALATTGEHASALASMVTHSRTLSLTCVKA